MHFNQLIALYLTSMYSQMYYIVIYSLWAGFNKKPSKRKPKLGIAPTLARAGEPPSVLPSLSAPLPTAAVCAPDGQTQPVRLRLRPSGPPSSAQRPSPSVRLRRSASELPNFSRAAAHRGGSTEGWGAAASRDIQGRRVRSAPAPARQRPNGLRRRVLLRKPAAQQGKMIAVSPFCL